MYQKTEKLDEKRKEMKISKMQLDEWLRLQVDKEEDREVMMKYTHEDEEKIKSLSLQLEKTNLQVMKLKTVMDSEVTHTQIAQLELTQSTDQFRKIHEERQELLAQWSSVLSKVQKKEDVIMESQETLLATQEVIRKKKELIGQKEEFINLQNEELKEKEKDIDEHEKELAKTRNLQLAETKELQEYEDQLYALKNEVYKSKYRRKLVE